MPAQIGETDPAIVSSGERVVTNTVSWTVECRSSPPYSLSSENSRVVISSYSDKKENCSLYSHQKYSCLHTYLSERIYLFAWNWGILMCEYYLSTPERLYHTFKDTEDLKEYLLVNLLSLS